MTATLIIVICNYQNINLHQQQKSIDKNVRDTRKSEFNVLISVAISYKFSMTMKKSKDIRRNYKKWISHNMVPNKHGTKLFEKLFTKNSVVKKLFL